MHYDLAQINEFLDYIFSFGPWLVYSVIFLACFVENLFPPFPGDTFILAAGGLVAIERLSLVPAFLTVIAGGMGSVMILYLLGRRTGREFFIRHDYKYFSAEDVVVVEQKLARWGWLILVASRFVVGMRSVLAIAAGIGKYPSGRMALFSSISYVIFTALLMYVAIKLVENIDRILYYVRTYNMIVWPIVVVVVIGLVVAKVVSVRRKSLR
ncbi:MAG TPA: DedA family protein [candidate division Zixibacteria bacterium]|nr:DedA family protein [candidate division Zixibacteria bacterium]